MITASAQPPAVPFRRRARPVAHPAYRVAPTPIGQVSEGLARC
jgi:hypothetical protein